MLATLSTPTKRIAYAALAAALLTASIVVIARDGHLWQFFAFGAAPDLALLLGIAGFAPRANTRKGTRPPGPEFPLHPRAVPLYNALHRFIGPVLLAFVPGFLVGALAWALHIAVDRSVGYNLRTRDGFQRA
jgi:hypothetical protein